MLDSCTEKKIYSLKYWNLDTRHQTPEIPRLRCPPFSDDNYDSISVGFQSQFLPRSESLQDTELCLSFVFIASVLNQSFTRIEYLKFN